MQELYGMQHGQVLWQTATWRAQVALLLLLVAVDGDQACMLPNLPRYSSALQQLKTA